jgi:multiple sugar transport system ATP-binding protein
MAEVRLENLRKVYPGGTVALDRLDLNIHQGELVAVLGPSGCGKSTLLNLLAGLETPSSGEILFDGRSVVGMEPRERNIAMVFQNYALYPHMTVRENLEFPLKMMGRSRAEIVSVVEETARGLGLQELLERKPRQLSGGQAQRVAMGRAIVRDPTLFLMDEPLSNLDAKLRVEIRSVITQLQSSLGTTTLYVTHDQVEALTIGQRVALLRSGELQQLDSPQNLYDRPANLFVAGFLGNPAMNLLRAELEIEEGALNLRIGSQTVGLSAESAKRALAANARIVGLRPENFAWPEDHPHWPQVEARVRTIEVLGHEQLLHLDAEVATVDPESIDRGEGPEWLPKKKGKLVARVPMRSEVSTEIPVRLALDVDALHWFDASGAALR